MSLIVNMEIGDDVRPSSNYVLVEYENIKSKEKKTKSGLVLIDLAEKNLSEKTYAVIKDWGDKVKPEEWGFEKGDCIIFLEGMMKTYPQFSEEKGDYYIGLILPRDIIGFFKRPEPYVEEEENK